MQEVPNSVPSCILKIPQEIFNVQHKISNIKLFFFIHAVYYLPRWLLGQQQDYRL